MTTRQNGSRIYVRGKGEPVPTQFAQHQHVQGRTFIDYDGTEYEILWPRGRMPISMALGMDTEEDRRQ